jgi:Dolichyl-phosphate-mannose-protein mannosyltransferase
MNRSEALRRRQLQASVPRFSSRGLVHVLLVCGVSAIPLILYLPFLNEPLMRDEGLYASVAQAMDHGAVPYQDAFDNKPPMVFAWYYVSFQLFGENLMAPRLVVALLSAGATYLLYIHARILFQDSTRALVAAAAFAGTFGIAAIETNANTEYFMVPFVVAMGLFFTLGQRSRAAGWYFAAGLAGGIAIMTKQTAAFPVAFLIAYAAWRSFRTGDGSLSALRDSGLIAVGALAAGLAITAPIVAAGAFPDMRDALFTYTLNYSSAAPTEARLRTSFEGLLFLLRVAGPWLILAATGAALAVRRGHNDTLFFIGWLLAPIAAIFVAGRFYYHYYVALFPALALLVPLAVAWLAANWRSLPVRFVALPVLVVLAGSALWASGDIYLRSSADGRHIAKYDDPNYPTRESQSDELADWVEANTRPGDKIYNIGFHSELYFLADRRSPTRYMFDHPLMVDSTYVGDAIAELEADPPVLVLDTTYAEHWIDAEGRRLAESDRPLSERSVYAGQPIREWVRENYRFIGQVYYADVYVLPDDVY